MKIDFRNTEVTNKQLFQSKLSGEPLHFGYIPLWQRKAFVKFCIKQNLIEKIPGNHPTSYKVNHVFAYKGTLHKTSWRAPVGCLVELFGDIFKIESNKYLSRSTIVVQHRDRNPFYSGYNYVQVRDDWLWGRWLIF